MKRTASAHWQGSTREGTGTLSVQSGTLRATPYSFKTRFGDGKGTNPEELIAAAHAGCFAMALSFVITKAGFSVDTIDCAIVLTIDDLDTKPTITGIEITCRARVPGIDSAQFAALADEAKAGCTVSRALSASIAITLDAALA